MISLYNLVHSEEGVLEPKHVAAIRFFLVNSIVCDVYILVALYNYKI